MTTLSETDLQSKADALVRANVRLCVSALVSTLAKGYGNFENSARLSSRGHHDAASVIELCEKAFELCAPIDDYEEAARQAGWKTADLTPGLIVKDSEIDSETGQCLSAESWLEACEIDGLDPYQWDVYEHWAVSEWFAEKLEAEGERIDHDFEGFCVWARTTTGQAISMDPVIRKITSDLYAAAED